MLGGPLFKLYRRAYLSGEMLELVRRRFVVIVAIAWLPPLVLSMHQRAEYKRIAFDELKARYKIALPGTSPGDKAQ